MNKLYNIKKISNTDFQYIIFSVDYHRVEDYISELSNELSRKSCKGMVIFDLLLSNGLNSDRYLKVLFDGNHFLFQTMETIDRVDKEIEKISTKFYKCKIEYLENSVLTRTQKFLIKKQLTI